MWRGDRAFHRSLGCPDHDEKARAHAAAFGAVLNLAVGLKGGIDDEPHQNWVELRSMEKKNP